MPGGQPHLKTICQALITGDNYKLLSPPIDRDCKGPIAFHIRCAVCHISVRPVMPHRHLKKPAVTMLCSHGDHNRLGLSVTWHRRESFKA